MSNPDIKILRDELARVIEEIKNRDTIIEELTRIVEELLENAVPDLFTFIRYPGMEPTNNKSERMLRKVAIHRKIRQKLVTVGGKIMFGTI